MQDRSSNSPLARGDAENAIVLAGDGSLAQIIKGALSESGEPLEVRTGPLDTPNSSDPDRPTLVVLAPSDSGSGSWPERLALLEEAATAWARRGFGRLILVSSAAVYGPDHRSDEFLTENAEKRPAVSNTESDWWIDIEGAVLKAAGDRAADVLILRPPAIVGGAPGRFFDRLFHSRVAFPSAGFDPSLQVISAESVADCIRTAFEKRLTGVYNVAPDDVVPLRAAMKFLGIKAIPIPRTIQRLIRPLLLKRIDGIDSVDQLNFLRYPCTISGEKFAGDTGIPLSTRSALAELRHERFPGTNECLPEFDRFGGDESQIRSWAKGRHRFLEKLYWRIERKGLGNIPKSGPALVVGPHRGFMPMDAVMLVHLITTYAGRVPRFLIHPTLVKFPFQAAFFRQMCGIMACQKNGDWVLDQGEVLGVFPEGIRGAFKMYRDVYKLGRFGRPDYIRWSLKYRAPVVPFVIVGTAEIYPILGKINWRRFKKFMEWPFFPITPTFPWIPLPLPTKWHVQFLPPVDPVEVEAEALRTGEDPEKLIGQRVREAIEAATAEMRSKRHSIFRGSVFGDERDTPGH